MKKTIEIVGTLLMAVLLCVNLIACGSDDDVDVVKPGKDAIITIGEDGSVSKGHTFVAVDDKTFFLDYVKYGIKDSHLEVEGHDSQLSGNLVIPSAIKYKGVNLNVIAIAEKALNECSNIRSVTIPSSVTKIGYKAFYGCSNVKELIYAEGCTTALQTYLTSIEKVVIPNSVTRIREWAFEGCSNLASITIPSGVTKIGFFAFSGCSSLTTINIPNSVTEIELSAFSGCSSLTTIAIPNSVTGIRMGTFSGCLSLTTINIPNSIIIIDDNAFSGCSSLTTITIPDSVTEIGIKSFSGCSSLKSVTNLAEEPQTITSETFSQYGTLHVKPGCGERYKKAEVWNKFKIVEDAKE